MIDWDRVSQLQDEVGRDDFKEVVEMFLDEVREELDTLSSMLTAKELEEKLHFLKGSALNLGLEAFAELCRSGETMARNGHAHAVETDVIITCYKASIQQLSDRMADSDAA